MTDPALQYICTTVCIFGIL